MSSYKENSDYLNPHEFSTAHKKLEETLLLQTVITRLPKKLINKYL